MSLFSKQELRTIGENVARASSSTPDILLQKSMKTFSSQDTYDIFLSHSFSDASIILGLKREIEDLGYSIYVDWIDDPQLDRTKVTAANANLLKIRMKTCKCLIYAYSPNSRKSIWMPWELGYFDGIKSEMVAILPIVDTPTNSDQYSGQEYLSLYCYVTKGGVRLKPEKTALWINENAETYVVFSAWLDGKKPTHHS